MGSQYSPEQDTPYVAVDYESQLSNAQRESAWRIGAGLQAIDGYQPSAYAEELMAGQIAGQTTYQAVVQDLTQYYAANQSELPALPSRETDITAVRIAQIVAEPGFTLSPGSLLAIHGRIFAGIFADERWAGRYRSDAILKKSEAVLGGESVGYTPGPEIAATMNWEFSNEKQLAYLPDNPLAGAKHVLDFISNIWQIHPFREGNTRALAAYAIKYLKYLGIEIDNEPFEKTAPYFRDALALKNAPRKLQDSRPLDLFAMRLVDSSIALPDLRATYPKSP